jgi:hypothetical protein
MAVAAEVAICWWVMEQTRLANGVVVGFLSWGGP